MNTIPTPRTDAQAGWAIANQYGQSTGSELLGDPNGVFVHSVFARTLERELGESRNAERLARVQLGNERARLDELISVNATGAARLAHAAVQLATERARLNSGTILLTVAGERVWACGVDLRAAIDAGMREGAQ